jgi:chitin disaccharide deacetylase
MMKRSLVAVLTVMVLTSSTLAQSGDKTIAERLGYPKDAKLLVVHADDLGMARSVNAASLKALDAKAISSASLMVPCPWFSEIAEYARAHPDADLGLHLTLSSEWKNYRWGPVLSRERAPSLFAPDGYLYPTTDVAAAKVTPQDAEAEIRAQVERAKAFGIKPTHLDSHMGVLYTSKPMFEAILKVGRENAIPVMISREWFAAAPFLPGLLQPGDVVIDRVASAEPSVTPEKWNEFYTNLIKGLQPGVTLLIVHLAYDDEEMRAATIDHPDWGAGWRQRDFDFVMNPGFKKLLEENGVKLVSWRELGRLRQ